MAEKSGTSCMVYFLAGIGVGALFALFFAPQSGEETRKMINEKVERGKSYVDEQRKAVRRTAEDLITEGRRKAEDLKEKAKDIAERAGFARPFET